MLKNIARNAGSSLVAAIITFVIGLITSVIAARLLSNSDFGLYSLVAWMIPAISLTLNTGVSSAIMKFVAELEGAQQRAVGNSLTIFLIFIQASIGLLASVLIFNFTPEIVQTLNLSSVAAYIPLVGIGVPLSMISIALRNRLAGYHRYYLISIVICVSSISSLVGMILVLYGGFGLSGLIILIVGVYSIEAVCYTIILLCVDSILPIARIPKAMIFRVTRYCFGVFLLTSIEVILWQRSEIFFLGWYSNTKDVAYYSLAYSLANALVVLAPTTLINVLMPVFSQQFGAGDRQGMQQIYSIAIRCIGIVALPISFVGLAIGGSLLETLYGDSYAGAIILLQLLLLASIANALAFPGLGLFVGLGRPDQLALWTAPIALLNLGLAFSFTRDYGATGAGMIKLTCQWFAVIVNVMYLIYFQGFKFPFLELLRTTIAAAIAAAIAYLVSTFMPGWFGIGIACLSAIAIYLPMLGLTQALTSTDTILLLRATEAMPRSYSVGLSFVIRTLCLYESQRLNS